MKTDRSISVHPAQKDKQAVKQAAEGMWNEATSRNCLQDSREVQLLQQVNVLLS
jgi:hypothetical protein